MNMEPRKPSEIIEQFQPLLKKYEKDEKLVLLEAEEELAVPPGENYKSLLLRTKVTGKRGNGSPYKKSFMRKLLINIPIPGMPPSEPLFLVESHVFNKVLPILKLETIGPDCLFTSSKEIVMEDLCQSGYSTFERKKMLDLEHTLATIKILAKLHASSLCYKLNMPEEFAQLVVPLNAIASIPPEAMQGFFKNFFLGNLQFAIRSVESIVPHTPQVEAVLGFLKGLGDKLMEVMTLMLSPPKEAMQNWVIGHGDMWINNVMFKYDEEKKVKDVKLIDFQMTNHVSPANDFLYFIYSSVRTEVIRDYNTEMLSAYERAFLDELCKCDAPKETVKVYEKSGWFAEEIKRGGMFGLVGGLVLMHAVMGHGMDAIPGMKENGGMIDLEKLKPENMEVVPEKTDRIFFLINDYLQNYAAK